MMRKPPISLGKIIGATEENYVFSNNLFESADDERRFPIEDRISVGLLSA